MTGGEGRRRIQAVDVELLDTSGRTVRLSDYWRDGLAAFVFVRHFGCIFCREQVQDLRDHAHEIGQAGLSVVIVTPGEPDRAAEFTERFRVPFPVLADPDREAYIAYGLAEGSVAQLINPRVIRSGIDATLKGHFLARPASNPRQLPGTAIVDFRGRLRFLHAAEDASDHLTSADLIAQARAIRAADAEDVPALAD